MSVRDYPLGATFDIKFHTIDDTGLPVTLAGSPTVAAYVGNGTTEITAGLTLSVDFDGRTGMHNLRVVATSGNGFADATDVSLVMTAGTVDGVSVVGYVVREFTIGRGAAYQRLGAPAGASIAADIATRASPADVNAQVLDVFNTDTFAEPGQGSPAATTTIIQKIGYLYKAWRNRTTQTASEYALFADDGTTKDQEAAVSDNGTTFDRGEVQTGA